MEPNTEAAKRAALLAAVGITLQTLGSICLFAATLGVVKEVNGQVKKALVRELSKNPE